MRFNIDDNFDHDFNFLVRNGLVEQDRGAAPIAHTHLPCLTEMGRMQAENMAARHTMVNLRTGIVSSPGSGGGSPESEGSRNNRRSMWAGNLVFDPRSIHRPANLRQRVPSRRFYHPREGKDSTWVDDSTTPEEEYQRRYYVVEVPEIVDVGEERKWKKARRADRKSPSTVVDRVVKHDLHQDGDNDVRNRFCEY
jgi:hypothetical protein